jgi:hypothetical protein
MLRKKRVNALRRNSQNMARNLGLMRIADANMLFHMMLDIDGQEREEKMSPIDVTRVLYKIIEAERCTPHEDEEWQELYEGIRFYDDVNGGEELDKDKVIEARKLEMAFFMKMGVYSKVSKDEVKKMGGKVISTKWLDTDKGHIYRSRLVGREIKRDKRQDLFSPTPPLEVVKMLVAKCAKGQNKKSPKRIGIVDVSRAYFYAKCKRPLYIEIPMEDWEPGDEGKVGRLNLSLYGTRDAAQNWAETYTEHLLSLEFKQGKASKCSFRHEKKDIDLTVHGDDFVIVGDAQSIRWLQAEMKARYEVKCSILGPDADMNKQVRILNRTLRWTPRGIEYEADSKHAKIIVKACGVENERVSRIPGSRRSGGIEDQEMLSPAEATIYRAVTARLNYLAADRADLQYASKCHSTGMANPTVEDWNQIKKTARYLKYRPRAIQLFKFESDDSLIGGFADSDWAGERPSMKSTSGGALIWGTSLLKSWSVTQSTVATSTAEAELYAMARCAQQALGLASLARDFGLEWSPVIHSDASAAIGVALRTGLGGRMRHVKVQYMWIQEAVATKEVELMKVKTNLNPADMLTKFLPCEVSDCHTKYFCLRFPEDPKDHGESQAEHIRLFAKHVRLADLQRALLARIPYGIEPRGGDRIPHPLSYKPS